MLCITVQRASSGAVGWARSRGGSAAARLCPADAIWSYSNGTLTVSGPRETASIFATYPSEHLSLPNGFLDQVGAGLTARRPHMAPHGPTLRPCRSQVLGTAVLIVGILAITDTRNRAVPRGLEPLTVALLVLAIEVSMGFNCGSPMNPARDFGPRLFTLAAGWGTEVFRWVLGLGPGGTVWMLHTHGSARSRGSSWWWVPVVAPLVGAALGTGLYQLFVAFHHPEEEEEDSGRARRQTKH